MFFRFVFRFFGVNFFCQAATKALNLLVQALITLQRRSNFTAIPAFDLDRHHRPYLHF